jgi:hypothetical protein
MECKCLYKNGTYHKCTITEQNNDLFSVDWHDGDSADRIDHPMDHFKLTKQVDLANDTVTVIIYIYAKFFACGAGFKFCPLE